MSLKLLNISVVGLGYIGLPTAAVLASRGHQVVGVDVNQSTVDIINQGDVHIVEPDLDMVVRAAVATGHLRATLIPEPADVFIIAVPTPIKVNELSGLDQIPDLTYIEAASKAIAPVLMEGNLVILESTCPVGATESMAKWLAELRSDLSFPQDQGESADILVAHCPERVLPGYVLQELVSNDRIIGGLSKASCQAAVAMYKTFVKGECIATNVRTAEMAKLTENSYRDVNIAFSNELSIICDQLKINVWELIKLANHHPRVNILNPGPGVGGHCIAVDPWFIVSSAPDQAKLIRQARHINDDKPSYVVAQIKKTADQFKAPVIACLGLAFKADIDDLRESPALKIVEQLVALNVGKIIAIEPNIQEIPEHLLRANVEQTTLEEALDRANIVVVLVDHKEFTMIDKSQLASKAVIDTRGIT